MKKSVLMSCGLVFMSVGLAGCGASFEGSGSKDAASAEQLALHEDDPWDMQITIDPQKRAGEDLRDGVYTGVGKGMEGPITVSLLVDNNRITCLQILQEGESQSRGGYEAIRDGVFAQMIEEAQGSDIDAISGATITTAGVKQAVDDALSQASASGNVSEKDSSDSERGNANG